MTSMRLSGIDVFAFILMLPVAWYAAAAVGGDTTSESAGQEQPTDYISFDSATQRFSASVDNRPFEWVIEQLKNEAGIGFTIFEDDYEPVSAQFDDLPLEKAIKQLLHGASHMISAGDSISIFVLSREGDGNADTETTAEDMQQNYAPGAVQPRTPQAAMITGTAAPEPQAPQDFKQHLIDSIGDTPELEELRMQLEQMPELELSEEEIRLLQDPSDGQIADILLNNLLQGGVNRPGQESVDTDQAPTAGE